MSSHCHPAPTDPHSPMTRKETEAERWEPTCTRVLLHLQFHGARFTAEVSSSPPKPLALAGSLHTRAPRLTPLGPCPDARGMPGCGAAGRAALHHHSIYPLLQSLLAYFSSFLQDFNTRTRLEFGWEGRMSFASVSKAS